MPEIKLYAPPPPLVLKKKKQQEDNQNPKGHQPTEAIQEYQSTHEDQDTEVVAQATEASAEDPSTEGVQRPQPQPRAEVVEYTLGNPAAMHKERTKSTIALTRPKTPKHS